MISAIIPARDEIYLQRTIDSLLQNAKEEIEIIVTLDGYWPNPPIKDDKRVTLIHKETPIGMRSAINSAAKVAKGKYLLKCDAHCAFAEGYDLALKNDCKYNWTVVPVRYAIDSNTWERRQDKKSEFEYISSDDLKGKKWPEFARRVKDQKIVDLMTFQGSCWFMHKDRFWELGGLDDINYGQMGREAQEVCLKTWLSGGRCVLNRNTWYAHWGKSKTDIRFQRRDEKEKSVKFASDFWLNGKWDKATRDIKWLVNKFSPVPTWEDMETDTIFKKGMARAGLYKYFAELGFKKGAEIGVQRGRNAWLMFEFIPDLELYLIEPYKDHPFNRRQWGEKIHAKSKKIAHKRLNGYNVKWIEGFSEDVSGEVENNSLDFVYIDGEHTYDFVMIDLILWSRKVRKGGIVSGHDYFYQKKYQAKVSKAVDNFVDAYKMRPIYLTDGNVREWNGDRSPSYYFFKK